MPSSPAKATGVRIIEVSLKYAGGTKLHTPDLLD